MANKTPIILDFFKQLSAFPRCSGNEAAVCSWLQRISSESGFASKVDEAGNIVILVPGTKGYEDHAAVVLQGHMDMVCEKIPESSHDFSKDPIQNIVDGDWMRADNTTLGSDNGIAIALALAVANDQTIAHPPLELLFTVKEEVGLSGVNFLKPGFITGNTLINLDSEDEGTFVVGCAGGETTHLTLPIRFQKTSLTSALKIIVSGCRGGHSGVDIHKNFANANKLLARTLNELGQLGPVEIRSISGGTAHNAISRGAEAVILLPEGKVESSKMIIKNLESIFQEEYKGVESSIRVSVEVIKVPHDSLSVELSEKVISVLNALPHGVTNMSASIPGFVETSNNLASIELKPTQLKIITSQRSTSMSKLREISGRVHSVARLAGCAISTETSYPAWQPNMNSKVLVTCKNSFNTLFGHNPEIQMIHAGLECSSIGDIYRGIDMISIGVTIENPHSPTERMYIPSIEKIWDLLVETLKNL